MHQQRIWMFSHLIILRDGHHGLRFLLSFCYFLFAVIFFPMEPVTSSAERKPCRGDKDLPSLLRAYDPDAYKMLRFGLDDGWDYSAYVSDPDRPVDSLGTIVHEAFHAYSYAQGSYRAASGTSSVIHEESFYLGHGSTRMIRYENVFPTEKAACAIPGRLRTFRYNAYVGKGSGLSSNQDGIYGLLNEFCAYYWGMRAMESIFPYLRKHAGRIEDWKAFVTDYCNYRNAYAEFYFYILEYFRYAKRYRPAIYKKLMKDKALLTTFRTMQKRYERLICRYERDLNRLSRQYNGCSLNRSRSHGIIFLGSYGWGAGDSAYELLMPVIRSRRYKYLRRRIAGYPHAKDFIDAGDMSAYNGTEFFLNGRNYTRKATLERSV